jgi:hypothetical protein
MYHGYILYKVEIIFPQSHLIIDTIFPPLRETLHTSCVKFLAKASELLTHAVFQLVVVRKTASSECILQGGKKVEVGGCRIKTVEGWGGTLYPTVAIASLVRGLVCGLALSCGRMIWFIFLLGRTFRIRCFNFFNVSKYRFEFIVAPLSKNSTNKIPSLSQKSLAMTLYADVCTLKVFLSSDDWWCHSIDCLCVNGL